MKNYIIIIALLFGISTNAQTWTPLTFSPDQTGLELNPLKGFADIYGPVNDFPRSINGKLFGLNEVMFGLNNFNFGVIDTFIAQNVSEGNYTYIQVNIDPGPDQNGVPQSYMPAFLDGQYDTYLYEGGVNDLVPDWNDPQVIEAMLNFIDKFGEEYNENENVFIVNLGLYGIYGEWQIGDAANPEHVPDFEMTLENRNIIANAYKAAFPDTYLSARYPESMPDPEIFGYSDGLYFTQSIAPNDNFFKHFYFDNTAILYNADQNWKTQVTGGEIDPCAQPILWLDEADSFTCTSPNNPSGDIVDIQNRNDVIDDTHPTFLFSHHIFTDIIADDPMDDADEWSNAIRAQKRMGYTFFIDEYRLTAENGFPSVEVNIQNTGVAPLYANWDVEFGVLDSNDVFQSLIDPTDPVKWNLNLILPDVANNYRNFTSTTFLPNGDYTFLLRIKNPIATPTNGAQPLRFANNTQDIDLEGWITLGQATVASGTIGGNTVAPVVPVTNLSLSPANTTLTVGNSFQLNATVSPASATNQDVLWISNKPGTASVDANGLITAGPSYGEATISAYAVGCGDFVEQPNNLFYLGETTVNVEPISVNIDTSPTLINAEDYIRMAGIVVGFQKLGFIDSLDWVDYSVTTSTTSNFFIDITASCTPTQIGRPDVPGEIRILDENDNLLDLVIITQTPSFNDFVTYASNSIELPAGTSKIRLEAKVGSYDLKTIEFRLDNTLGVDTFAAENAVTLYPNPTNGLVTIKASQDIKKVVLYDIAGRQILETNATNKINMEGLSSGIYLAEIFGINNEKVMKRIAKR